nr:putative capsid [Marmot picobirnavirus]
MSEEDNQMAKQNNNSTKESTTRSGSSANRGNRNNKSRSKRNPNSKGINYKNAQIQKVKEQIERDSKKSSANDISWYSRNPELLRSAGSLPFATIAGSRPGGFSVPGVMEIDWIPAFGSGTKPVALNQAADSMYSFVVHANSRNYSYTAPDLMILTLAGMQVYAMIGAAVRAYGTLKYYNERNSYLPDALIMAMGFNPQNLRANLSQMWFDINNFIDQSRQIWIPNTMPLLERWYWLNSHVFQDGEGERAQKYVFKQSRYFMYAETTATTGSSLVTLGDVLNDLSEPSGGWTWAIFKQGLQDMIDALINSEDRGIIYGDLLNAYGQERMYMLQSIPADYTIQPEYNAEVLCQIENTVECTGLITGLVQIEEDLYPVYQGTNANPPEPSPVYGPSESVLNFHMDGQPAPELVMEATRLNTTGCYAYTNGVFGNASQKNSKAWTPTATNAIYAPYAMGSELVRSIKWWVSDPSTSSGYTVRLSEFVAMTAFAQASALEVMAFDWHPFIYQLRTKPGDAPVTGATDKFFDVEVTDVAGDFDNYIIMSPEEVKKLHDTAMFSLFGVPIM